MAYPSIEQYQELVQNPHGAFTDPVLASGRVRASGLGTPIVVSGGFALTYALEAGGTKYAVRCFHRDAPNLEKRYAAISKALSSLGSTYFVQFEYQTKGLRANGKLHPLVKMTWASGVTLGEFVEANYSNAAALDNLANSLKQLEAYLVHRNLAHGDIQEGNLMVADHGKRIQLIDYDGMFVPELSSLGGSELGHRDYQHPRREAKHYDATLDRFSLISLSLSLRALIAQPGLWNSSQSGAGVILFRANDFANPSSSRILTEIGQIPSLIRDAQNFVAICAARFEQVPSLADFLAAKNIPAFDAKSATLSLEQARQGYISQYPVLDGARYDIFEQKIGEMVELVGRVVDVRNSFTKHGKPYIFVNFGDWRVSSVKIALWSEALGSGHNKPGPEWVGRWVAIRGLVEPIYRNKKQGYKSISITAASLGQLTLLTEAEAKYRLVPITVTRRPEITSNADALQRLTGRATANPVVLRPAIPLTAKQQKKPLSQNEQALARMQQQVATKPSPTTPSRSSPAVKSTHTPPPSQNSHRGPSVQPPSPAQRPPRVPNSNKAIGSSGGFLSNIARFVRWLGS
jgi:hypothetical protein